MRGLVLASCAAALLCAAACRRPAEGPVKGVLVVYPDGCEETADSLARAVQRYVRSVDPEPVFAFTFVPASGFEGLMRHRRTVLLLPDVDGEYAAPLQEGPVPWARDVWATGQAVYGARRGQDPGLLGDSLEAAYDRHLRAYLYESFVSTSMSSPERMDSLSSLGFVMDVPRSYSTREWRAGDGFLQFQRPLSEEGLLMLSVRWQDGVVFETGEEAAAWREQVARRFFHDAGEDSVDRARLETLPLVHGDLTGWRLTGAWRNPRHLNAGAFTSYVIRSGSASFLLDMEVFNPGGEKEPYIREGWLIMNTFAVGR